MKVLVFDDSDTHCNAARAQLKDHDLTVVGTYDEAVAALEVRVDGEKINQQLKERFGDFNRWRSKDEVKNAEYDTFREEARNAATTYPGFDAVLTDLLVPASANQQASKEFVGKEMPLGIFIGLLAAVKARAKYVAVFTDSNHHKHPASACIDPFSEGIMPQQFSVEGARVMLVNNTNWVAPFYKDDLARRMSYREFFEDQKKPTQTAVKAKNWARLLEFLLDPTSREKEE